MMSGTNLTIAKGFLRTGRSEEVANGACLVCAGNQQEYLVTKPATYHEIQNHVEEALNKYTKTSGYKKTGRKLSQNDLLIFRLGHKELNEMAKTGQDDVSGVAESLNKIFSAFNAGVLKPIGNAFSKAAP